MREVIKQIATRRKMQQQKPDQWNKKVSLDYKRARTPGELLRGRKVVSSSADNADAKYRIHHQVITSKKEKVKRPQTVDVGCVLRRDAVNKRYHVLTEKLELRKYQRIEKLESRKCKLPEIRFKFSPSGMFSFGGEDRNNEAAGNDLFAKLTKKWAKYSNKHENCIVINNYFR